MKAPPVASYIANLRPWTPRVLVTGTHHLPMSQAAYLAVLYTRAAVARAEARTGASK